MRIRKKSLQIIYAIKKSGELDHYSSDRVKRNMVVNGYYHNPYACSICLNETPNIIINYSDFLDTDELFHICLECCEVFRKMSLEQIEEMMHMQSKGLSLRFAVLERDHFRCVYCGRSPTEHGITLHVDHVIPRSKGGQDILSNLVTSCTDCNLGKRFRIIKLPGHLKEYLEVRDSDD